MSIFQSIDSLAKRLSSQKESDVDSVQQTNSIEYEYVLGLEYKNNGAYLQAIDLFKSVENKSPGFREIYALLQETYELAAVKEISNNNFTSALTLLKKSQALSRSDSKTAQLLSHKAFCEHNIGQTELSIETLKKAVQADHDGVLTCYAERLSDLGWENFVVQEDKNKLREEAEKYYKEGFKCDKAPEKLALYKKAVTLCPDYVEAYYSIGCLYNKLFKIDNAVSALEKAFRLNPEYENGASILAMLMLEQKKYFEAIPYLKIALNICKLDDEKAKLHAHLAYCKLRGDDKVGAIDSLIESFKINSKVSYEKYYDVFDESYWEQCIEKSQSFEPTKHSDRNQFIAEQYWKYGFKFNNPHFYNKALEFNPQHDQTHYSLGCYYYKRGEGSEALKHLKLVDTSEPCFAGTQNLINSIKDIYETEPDIVQIEENSETTSDESRTLKENNSQDYEENFEKLKSYYLSKISDKDEEIAALQLKVEQLTQKTSDDKETLDDYEVKLQAAENIKSTLKTYYITELSNKDKEIETAQQKITKLFGGTESLKASFVTERQELIAKIDGLKHELINVKNQLVESKVNAPVEYSAHSPLSFQDISIINKSSFWGTFRSATSPHKLISNYLWDKSRSDLLSSRYGAININLLAKQLNLTNIADTEATVNSCLVRTLYDFMNVTVDSDSDIVILCITALMTLIDAPRPELVEIQTDIDLPTVTEPSKVNHSFAIPPPPIEETVTVQPLQVEAGIQLDIEIPPDTLVSVPFSSILQQIPSISIESFGRVQLTAIVNILGKMNIGMEPDPRFGFFIPKAEQDVVLFRLGGFAPIYASSEYAVATVVLDLASVVDRSYGDFSPEMKELIEEHLDEWFHLRSCKIIT